MEAASAPRTDGLENIFGQMEDIERVRFVIDKLPPSERNRLFDEAHDLGEDASTVMFPKPEGSYDSL